MIDLFDPNDGTLIASTRVPEPFFSFVAPGLLAGPREDDNGIVRLEIASVRLLRDR